jgi:hypothetical protein
MPRFAAWLLSPAILAAFSLAVTPAPALAAVTGAQLTATAPSPSGPCPVSLAFTGMITGSPGTTFTYSFNRFIDGVQRVQDVGNATIPASGTLAVNDSFSITTASVGVNFDQVWVHNILGGQPDVYSLRAPFSVTCISVGSPPPSGVGKFGTLTLGMRIDPDDKAHNPAPPFSIATSGDPRACAAHMANSLIAGLLCQPIAAASKLFILWNWEPHTGCYGCPQDVDGFKIYLTDAGMISKTYLTQTSAGVSATVSVLDVPAGGFVGKCYAVSAYKGAKESSLGQRTCIGAEPHIGSTISKLAPAHMRSAFKRVQKSGLFIRNISQEGDGGTLRVGFYYFSEESNLGDSSNDRIDRGAVMFDVSSLVGRALQKAVLHLNVGSTSIGTPSDSKRGPLDPSKSCAAELGTGRDAWWNNGNWIEADWIENPSRNGPNVDIDVTNAVRSWMNGAANFGFVLRGSSEDLSAFRRDVCTTEYDSATLEVEHF